MITHMAGNMFLLEAETLVNAVNCVGTMGKGIAAEFRRRWPGMYTDYAEVCRLGLLRPGLLHFCPVDASLTIVNFATKDHWINPSKPEWIDWGLRQLYLHLRAMPDVRVGIPALGCGEGGMYWPHIKDMMIERLGRLPNQITIFEPFDKATGRVG